MPDITAAMKLLVEFWETVDSIYGIYLDASQGFHAARDRHIKEQQLTINHLKKSSPELANLEYLDSVGYMYGEGNPNDPSSVILHKCSQGEFKENNAPKGKNYVFIANMCIVAIYQYWEDHYREQIATVLEKEKNDVGSDIMGDINLLRQSIIHNHAIAIEEVKKCKILTWFKKGDSIFVDWGMFKQLIYQINTYVQNYQKELAAGEKGRLTEGHSNEFGG